MPQPKVTSFADVLIELDASTFEDKISRALSDVALGVVNTGKTGKLVITLDLKQIATSHQVNVKHSVKYVKPTVNGKATEENATETPLYVGVGGKTIEISDGDIAVASITEPRNLDVTIEPRELEWSKTLCDGKSVDYETAEKACAALGDGWRRPTRMELESILDLTRHDPAIDTSRFPDTKSAWYWTSTPCAWAPGASAWVVDFGYGHANSYLRSNDACVRAVRSVPAGQ